MKAAYERIEGRRAGPRRLRPLVRGSGGPGAQQRERRVRRAVHGAGAGVPCAARGGGRRPRRASTRVSGWWPRCRRPSATRCSRTRQATAPGWPRAADRRRRRRSRQHADSKGHFERIGMRLRAGALRAIAAISLIDQANSRYTFGLPCLTRCRRGGRRRSYRQHAGTRTVTHRPKGVFCMRHYEIVFIVHPDQSEQVPAMVERYRTMVTGREGLIHRLEDWGRRQLAYPIQKVHKAHYVLHEHRVRPGNAGRARARVQVQRRGAAPSDRRDATRRRSRPRR